MFKTILFMYGWIQNSDVEKAASIVEEIKGDPLAASFSLWRYISRDRIVFLDCYPGLWGALKEYEGPLFDKQVTLESSHHNRADLATASPAEIGLKRLRLLDCVLGDDTEITMPNRMDIGVGQYFCDNLEVMTSLDSVYEKTATEKFHMPPSIVAMHGG